MRHWLLRLAAAAALFGSLTAPLAADPVSDVGNPFAGSGPWDAMCPPMNRSCEFHNFWHQYMKTYNTKQLLYGYARMGAAQGEAQPLVMRVTDDAAADTIPRLAEQSQRAFPGQSVPAIIGFMHRRINDYVRTVRSEGLVPESLPVGCDYVAESLYEVGTGRHVDGGTTRLNIRATCTIVLAMLEQKGMLQDNAQRIGLLQYLAIAGSTYRERDAAYVAMHNDAYRRINAENARVVFKSLFNVDEAKLPPDQFPCILADQTTSCSDLMHQAREIAPKLVEKYP